VVEVCRQRTLRVAAATEHDLHNQLAPMINVSIVLPRRRGTAPPRWSGNTFTRWAVPDRKGGEGSPSLLLATSRRSGYQDFFDDDEMLFFDDAEELADRVGWAVSSDQCWRTMAERARSIAARTMGGELVAEFILAMTMG